MAFAEPVVLFATERNIDLWEVSIAVDGHIAVVQSGRSASVQELTGIGWAQRQVLPFPDGGVQEPGTLIMSPSVAVQGSTLAMGYPFDNRVAIWRDRGGWVLQTTIDRPEPSTRTFGDAVAIAGDRLAVGAPSTHLTLPDQRWTDGAVYLYSRHGEGGAERWVLTGTPTFPDGENALIGSSFAFSADLGLLFVGAPGYGWQGNTHAGGVYVVAIDSGIVVGVIPCPMQTSISSPDFGSSVDATGRWLVVGAPRLNVYGSALGVAYLFELTGAGYVLRQQLVDPACRGWFGASVSISQDTLVVTGRHDAVVYEQHGNQWRPVHRLRQNHVSYQEGMPAATDGNHIVTTSAGWQRESDGSWALKSEIRLTEGSTHDRFGTAVAMHGARAVVGASSDDTSTTDGGAVYVNERSGPGDWKQVARLTDSAGATGDAFGHAVAVQDDIIAVGAPAEGLGTARRGQVVVFEAAGHDWKLRARLSSPGDAADFFGTAVAVAGDVLFVGARVASVAGVDRCGAVFTYRRDNTGAVSTWAPVQVLVAPDATRSADFGAALAVSGQTLAIGAPRRNGTHGQQSGALYVATLSAGSWQVSPAVVEGAAPHAGLGASVDVQDDKIVAGAPFRSFSAGQPGYAVVVEGGHGAWTEIETLRADDPTARDLFGTCVTTDGQAVLVASGSGRPIHVFTGRAAVPEVLQAPPEAGSFGTALVLQPGGPLLVGAAHAHSPAGASTGAVYAYERA